jgi:DNA-directed RNA polymerase I and III subunit RPAC1
MGGEVGEESDKVPRDTDTISLSLKVKCEWKGDGLQKAMQGETDPEKLYNNHAVYAKDLEWTPTGAQTESFKDGEVKPTNPDILIVKMRPGQEVNLQAHAVMGTGQDHAKFSPVATASYRLLPTIDIVRPIVGAEARKFMRCFPRGVITLEKITAQEAKQDPELKDKEGEVKAVVANAMKDSVSRECLRHPEFKDKVKLGRVRDHFIFKVESTGQWESDELFVESVKLLKLKAQKIRAGLNEMSR